MLDFYIDRGQGPSFADDAYVVLGRGPDAARALLDAATALDAIDMAAAYSGTIVVVRRP